MKTFNDKLTLNKNSRGCYILDTVKGCSCCETEKPNGCYDDCYAKKIASRYKIDFIHPVKRDFIDNSLQLHFPDFYDSDHILDILKELKHINMPFVRIGEMGDPSENWEHTINVCSIITAAKIPIVIITKHWKKIPDGLLKSIRLLDLCINTSISSLDTQPEREHRLQQYDRLQNYCKSVLRVVSCNFNTDNELGYKMAEIQKQLFENDKVLDTVFRPSSNNPLVVNKIINVEKVKFLKSTMLASRYRKNAYLGRCETCTDMCGLNL